MTDPSLTHEQKVEKLLTIIASATVASFAYQVSTIPDSEVTVKFNSQMMANNLAEQIDEITSA